MMPNAMDTEMTVRIRGLTIRMSHAEERASDAQLEQQGDRAPRHWLDPLVRWHPHFALGSHSSMRLPSGSMIQAQRP